MLSARDIVKVINHRLETTWSDQEWYDGKRIDVRLEWKGRMNFIVSEYRRAGWKVRREVVISSNIFFNDDYLIFQNPDSIKMNRKKNDSSRFELP